MSKSYFNYIQPTIVKLSDDPELPENLRGHYMVNVNVVGIPYFVDNFMLIEDGAGGYMYMMTNDAHKIRLSDDGLEGVIDIPRAYLVIDAALVESQDDFSSWILSSIADNSYFLTGTEKFVSGTNFFINKVLYDYLKSEEETALATVSSDIMLPNYLDGTFSLTKYWTEVPVDLARYSNFNYFRLKNIVHDLEYSEDELDSLCQTFMKIISDGAELSEEDAAKTINQTYKLVIDYFKNYETDDALQSIAFVMNTLVYSDTASTACNCSTSSSTTNEAVSCYDAYKQAMATWLTKMLGDVDFYKDWMYLTDNEGNLYVNEGLVQQLVTLLENFETASYDLSFSGKSIYNHNCEDSYGDAVDETNHKTIQNYITLLKWVLNGCIDNNANKIKIIGEKFGALLPKLSF